MTPECSAWLKGVQSSCPQLLGGCRSSRCSHRFLKPDNVSTAASRIDDVEIQSSLLALRVTHYRRRGAENLAAWVASLPPPLRSSPSADQDLKSLLFLVGSVDHMVDELRARRGRYGIYT